MSSKSDHQYSNTKQGLILALITSFAWSTLGICIKYANLFIDAITLSGARFAISAVVLFLFFLVSRNFQIQEIKKFPKIIIWAGLGLACNYVGFAKGVMIANATSATIIAQLGPLLLAFVGIFIFKDEISKKQLIGLGIAILGFSLFYFGQLQFQNAQMNLNQGTMWLIFGAITWTLWGYIHKKLALSGFNITTINFLVYLIAFISLSPLMNWTDLMSLNLRQFLFVVLLGANTLIAYGALSIAIKKAPGYLVSMMIALYPIMTIALIHLLDLLGISPIPPEPINSTGLIGALCVVCGVVFAAKKS